MENAVSLQFKHQRTLLRNWFYERILKWTFCKGERVVVAVGLPMANIIIIIIDFTIAGFDL